MTIIPLSISIKLGNRVQTFKMRIKNYLKPVLNEINEVHGGPYENFIIKIPLLKWHAYMGEMLNNMQI